MAFFVDKNSIVRKIWGNGDTILFIFAGASAEFALNKAVDWLYFTGKLPSDPLGRLFSTVAYARQIVFSDHQDAMNAIDKITAIHKGVEQNRGSSIPDWAYRDVLFMLIDYSIRSFEVLEHKMTEQEKSEVYEVFNQVGQRMGISGLPKNFKEWQTMRDEHLEKDLRFSNFTKDLYKQYRKHLGLTRYTILKQAQLLVVPKKVNRLLTLGQIRVLKPVIEVYKLTRYFKVDKLLKNLVMPRKYKTEITNLDVMPH